MFRIYYALKTTYRTCTVVRGVLLLSATVLTFMTVADNDVASCIVGLS